MDKCNYCNDNHPPYAVCEGYIKALEDGKITWPSEEPCRHEHIRKDGCCGNPDCDADFLGADYTDGR